MKNVFYSILLFSCICIGFAACTGGAYNASPSSNANYVINPLTPLTQSQFTWGVGSTVGAMGAVINGVPWATNNVSWGLDTGANVLHGILGSQIMYLYLKNVYTGNIYPMSYHQYNQSCTWSDSVGSTYNVYPSYYGNSGEVYITLNDSLSIQGMFYCEGITSTGQITAINNGYFNISKI